MPSVDRVIWNTLKIKRGDPMPYVGDGTASRKTLAEIMREVGYKTGAEIGVQLGLNSEMFCQTIPGLKLFCIDPWVRYNEARLGQEGHERFYQKTKERLSKYNVTILRMTSMEALSKITDNSLDFVYIDGHHTFTDVTLDIIGWTDKVRKGGIISGHDYLTARSCKVKDAVDGCVRGMKIKQWYLATNAHDDRRQPERNLPSWFWVKM